MQAQYEITCMEPSTPWAVGNCSPFYRPWQLITMFMAACHWSISWARRIKSTSSTAQAGGYY